MVRPIVSCLLVVATSCGALGTAKSPASYGANGPSPAQADAYCGELRALASSRAQKDMYWAFTFGAAAALAAGTSPVLLARYDQPSGNVRTVAAAGPLLAGVMLVFLKGMLARESAADELAHQTSDSLTQGDSPAEMVNRCTKALSEWDRSRTDAAKIAGNMQTADKQQKDAYKDLLNEIKPHLPTSVQEKFDKVPGLNNGSAAPSSDGTGSGSQ